jgi:CRISPR-associated protein Csm3
MQLTAIRKLTGVIELVTGLHIGSGNTEMHIGGTDNPVIKHPVTHEPYIPGSSLKGKMRSLLEWRLGVIGATNGEPLGFRHLEEPAIQGVRQEAENLLRLFGGAPEGGSAGTSLVEDIGPTRLAFWDCGLRREWVDEMTRKSLLLTETKMENMIDRIRGVAQHPRNTERVPAGAQFDFALTIRVHDHEDRLPMIFEGLKLLELTGMGGSGSRGYGKIRFTKLNLDDEDVASRLDQVKLIEAA